MNNARIALHYSNLQHFSYILTFKHKKLINNPVSTTLPFCASVLHICINYNKGAATDYIDIRAFNNVFIQLTQL